MPMNGHSNGNYYDVIIVGAGTAGSLIAKRLGEQEGRRVLVLEGGTGDLAPGEQDSVDAWLAHLSAVTRYYESAEKHENSPYKPNPAVPSPTENLPDRGHIDYYVQKGKLPYVSTYLRQQGGSMLHWQGVSPRMLPADLSLEGVVPDARNWPIDFTELERWYERAECELGVSGDAQGQREVGSVVNDRYHYPMYELPLSYQDQVFQERLDGRAVSFGEYSANLCVRSVPQARNSTPNSNHNCVHHTYGDGGYRPPGAVGLYDYGERCNGNSNCIPICPVQAKYTPLKTQAKIDPRVEIRNRAVVSRVLFEGGSEHWNGSCAPVPRGRSVVGVEYRTYSTSVNDTVQSKETFQAYARVVVLAAHAIENAKLLLASGARDCNDHGEGPIGRHLMDHPVLVTWGRMPESIGAFRGPMSTASIDCFRDGPWRSRHSPFRIEPDNWGWSLPVKSPTADARNLIWHGDERGRGEPGTHVLGPKLRKRLERNLPRQIQLSFSMEQPPDRKNRVRIDDNFRDSFGLHRPVIDYDLSEYVCEGFLAAREVSRTIFTLLGAEDCTDYADSPNAICFSYRRPSEDKPHQLAYWGGSHAGGTHIMGDDPDCSVVDEWQESHDHPGLYVVGSGSMPSMGTSNPSLTLAALALRTAEYIDTRLRERAGHASIGHPAQREHVEGVSR